MPIHLTDLSFSTLNNNPNYFDCGDDDLNDFFLNDSIKYQKILLAKTFYWLDDNKNIIGFISLLNDVIELKSNKKSKKFPREKHFRYYPAVKIGRLGISKNFQKK